eukprot:g17177.t1
MVGDQKVLLFVKHRVLMLYRMVSESTLGLTNVEEATSRAVDAIDHISGYAGEPLSNMEAYVEQSLFRCYTSTIPHHFLRYIDDCIGAALCSHEELEQFINFTNTFHHNLKFTWTI